MPSAAEPGILLNYRTSFLAALLAVGATLTILGPIFIIGSIITIRPQGILAGILMIVGGTYMMRHYLPVLRSSGRAYRIDAAGIARLGADAYEVPWRDILGIHIRRRLGRPHDVFVYLKKDPTSGLFFRSVDLRAALFELPHPEAPNQIHFRLSHFKRAAIADIEDRLARLAPRRGAFPSNAEILEGRLLPTWFLWPFLGFVFTAVALLIYVSSTHAPSATTLAYIAAPWLTLMILRALRLHRRSGAIPCLIIAGGRLYLPATPLGSVAMSHIINAKFRLGALMVMFSTPQPQIDSEGSHGLLAVAPIVLPRRTRRKIRDLFTSHNLWKTGKKPQPGRAQPSPAKVPRST